MNNIKPYLTRKELMDRLCLVVRNIRHLDARFNALGSKNDLVKMKGVVAEAVTWLMRLKYSLQIEINKFPSEKDSDLSNK